MTYIKSIILYYLNLLRCLFKYGDDTFLIWRQNRNTLNQTLEHLKNIYFSIKFTLEIENN